MLVTKKKCYSESFIPSDIRRLNCDFKYLFMSFYLLYLCS